MNLIIEEKKRLFFAFDVISPWPEKLPEGKIIPPKMRHLTLVFLGETNFSLLKKELKNMPLPKFLIAPTGIFDQCYFLPKRGKNVVAWHMQCLEKEDFIKTYQKDLQKWAEEKELCKKKEKDFFSHVTLCRKPFLPNDWKKAFSPLPFAIKSLHLYESLGHSKYVSLKKWSFLSPFEGIFHTADVSYKIRGDDIFSLHLHAQISLSFYFPPIIQFFTPIKKREKIEDVIIDLNALISITDAKIGCPIKAISLHGQIKKIKDNILEWEMILDV